MSTKEAVHVLDNPVWHALTTHQAQFALGEGLARRYHPDIAPFVALANASEAAFADLAQIVSPGEQLVLRGFELPSDPLGWTIHIRKMIVQMVSEEPLPESASAEQILTLSEADVPDMLRLVGRGQTRAVLAAYDLAGDVPRYSKSGQADRDGGRAHVSARLSAKSAPFAPTPIIAAKATPAC